MRFGRVRAAFLTGSAFFVALSGTAIPTESGAGVATPDGTLKADAIYLRAIRAMKAERQPAYVVFREDVAARNAHITCTMEGTSLALKHGDATAAYRVWFRVRDAVSVVQDLATNVRCRGSLLRPTGDEVASLGTSTASPQPSPAGAAEPAASATPAAAATHDPTGAPALIGAVHVEASRFYRITLAAREAFEGHDVFRLTLRAYRDSNAHPLTEMLVDTDSFLVRRVSGEVSGHYIVASGRGAGTIVFDRVGPYWIVRDEDFELAINALFVHARTNVTVRGSQYVFADALPEIVFPTPSPAPSKRAAH